MYKSTPITKKAKIAGEYNSALKQVDLVGGSAQTNPGFKSYDLKLGKEGTPSTTTTVEREKPQVGGYRRACGSKNDGSTGTDPETGNTFVCKQAEKGKEPEETEKVEVTTPGTEGTPDEITSLQTKRKTYKDNVGDLENREMNRVIKKAEKDVRRGEAKKARIENKKAKFENKLKKDEEGNIIAPKAGEKGYRKYKRLEAKGTETTRELSAFQDRAANAAEGQASGKGLDTRFRSTDVDETQGDFTRPEQIERLKMQKTYDASTQTDSQRFANEAAKLNKFKLTSADTSAGDSFINKFGVPMRAPMKKNYFKK
jgi:hypothetical protein